MTNSPPSKAIRELDRRTSDGIDVRLLWDSGTDRVIVTVHDTRVNDLFEFQVSAADALTAFHHPYAYADRHGHGDLLAA